MATPHLTAMRRAVWAAIDNWPPFTSGLSKIKRKVKYEDDGATNPAEYVPSIGDLPAVQLIPGGRESPWATYQGQEVTCNLRLVLWTPKWSVLMPERFWEELQRCFWQSAPVGTTQTYIAAACEQHSLVGPDDGGAVQIGDGGPVVTRREMGITLKKRWNPRLETETLT